MERRRLGRTGHSSRVVTLGTAAIGRVDQAVAYGAIQAALEAGVNHVDVAPTYGDAELRLQPWMPRIRDRIFLGCKTRERSREAAKAQLHGSLERLGTGRCDLYQLHAVSKLADLDACTGPGGALEALVEARAEGLVRLSEVRPNNDSRLRRLVGSEAPTVTIPVGRLPRSAVEEVLARLRLEPKRFTESQLELLSIPLHLALLAEVAADPAVEATEIRNPNDLYARFWDTKHKAVDLRLGRAVAWTRVIDILCDCMSEHQVLSVPSSFLDECRADAETMASEHVLARDGIRYSFFHEGFFDYAFARRFAARGRTLIPFLL